MNILITGISGFIGFHTALALSQKENVIGIDNFSSYYSVRLKKQRAKILQKKKIKIYKKDIQNTIFLKKILKKHKITHILHLAAQAGVRYSLKNPSLYIDSNISGFLSILEACKNEDIKIIFASSSSVYGNNKKIPFEETDRIDLPSNLYAVTKKTNELMAYAYHHLYKIPLIGLRYFTVYGPWGRPDMAYFSFTKNILSKKPIEIFNKGNMMRDFTYISDIVKGTVNALYIDEDFEIFNLGNNKPISLLYFVELLEKNLKTKAIKKFLPMQKAEVLQTYADIEKSKKKLHFYPNTSIEEGIEKFIHWYQNHCKFF